ncbi:MAG: Crp/Fnr family transcriptional regulator [Pseudomonadota bacterium]
MDQLILELFSLNARDKGAVHLVPEDLAQEFANRATSIRKGVRQSIITQTDQTDDVYLIESGTVEFSQLSPSSKETVFRECGPGEMFGELAALDNSLRSLTATATCDCTLLKMSGTQFQDLIDESPQFRNWLLRSLAYRVRGLSLKVFSLATMTVPCRLWTELLRRAREVDAKTDSVEIKNFPTHSKLAATLGTHREAVSRELSELTKDGIIAQDRRTMTVKSVSKLEHMLERYLS